MKKIILCMLAALLLLPLLPAAAEAGLEVGATSFFLIGSSGTEETVAEPCAGRLKTRVRVKNSGAQAAEPRLVAALYEEHTGAMTAVNASGVQQVAAGGSADLSVELTIASLNGYRYRYFVWDSLSSVRPYQIPENIPVGLTATPGAKRVTLSWDVLDGSPFYDAFIVRRDGVEIARTPYLSYTDNTASEGANHVYTVANVKNGVESAQSEPVTAAVEENRMYYYGFDDPDVSKQLTHYKTGELTWNEEQQRYETNTSDNQTVRTAQGGRNCRMLTDYYRTESKTTTHSNLYFQVDPAVITEADRNLTFEVTYYDSADFGTITIQYNANYTEQEGTEANIDKRAPEITAGGTNKWKTVAVSVTDARLRRAPKLSKCDFRVASSGGKKAFVAKVAVCKTEDYIPDTSATVADGVSPVRIDYDAGISGNGLSNITTADTAADAYIKQTQIGGKTCMVTASYYDPAIVSNPRRIKYHYFCVDDGYMYGSSNGYAKITITYFDQGTQPITLQYNAASGSNNLYKSVQLAKKTNTGEWKTATVELTDCSFVNGQGNYRADFRIMGNESATVTEEMEQLYLSSVTVLRDREQSAGQSQ